MIEVSGLEAGYGDGRVLFGVDVAVAAGEVRDAPRPQRHGQDEIWRVLATLKEGGQAILAVDKNIAPLLRLADRHYILEKGRTVWSGSSPELAAASELQHRYLGV
jgi:ABC-type branched-subunit amino acid transport system ATPase component